MIVAEPHFSSKLNVPLVTFSPMEREKGRERERERERAIAIISSVLIHLHYSIANESTLTKSYSQISFQYENNHPQGYHKTVRGLTEETRPL